MDGSLEENAKVKYPTNVVEAQQATIDLLREIVADQRQILASRDGYWKAQSESLSTRFLALQRENSLLRAELARALVYARSDDEPDDEEVECWNELIRA